MGWRSFFRAVVQVVLVVAAFVAPQLALAIGTSIGLEGAAAVVVGNAVIGGTSAALTGGDIEKGIVGGAVSGAVSGAIGEAIGATGAVGEAGPQIPQPSAIQSTFPDLSADAASGLTKGITAGGGKLAGALATGSSVPQALKQAGVAGVASGLPEYIFGPVETGSVGSAGKALAGYGISRALGGPDTQYVGSPPSLAPAGTTAPQTALGTTTGAEPAAGSPGSAALAQVLRTDPGGPLFGSYKDEKQRRVWNEASLRLKDETGG